MIIVKLQGGLGNQMFQYAFGRALVAKNGGTLVFDPEGFNTPGGITKRSYRLDVFGIEPTFAKPELVSLFSQEKNASFLTKIKRKFGTIVPRYIQENPQHFNSEIFSVAGDTYFDGHWQTEKYFTDIDKEIREAFKLKKVFNDGSKKIADMIVAAPSISLQIRRGDYVLDSSKASKIVGGLSIDYYEKALAYVAEKTGASNLFVFTDDPAWAEENVLWQGQKTIVSGPNIPDYEEIALMSLCNHHIISNSSFGWWGAWLDTKPEKIVVAPQKWFKDERFENVDSFPPSWIRM